MLRAPVDTNVLVSGITTPFENGSCFDVFKSIVNGGFCFLTSIETQRELVEALSSMRFTEKLAARKIVISEICKLLETMSKVVKSDKIELPVIVRDVTDQKFLELAITGDADYFVTNDKKHLLPLKKIGRTKIVTPHKFMMALNATR